jgi:hypothetical protein
MNLIRGLTKLLFGGGSGGSPTGDVGLYYYVKSKRSGEILRVRVNPNNDLSEAEEGDGYFARKHLYGSRGYDPIELELNYNKDRKLTGSKITGGDMVDQAAFEAQQRPQPQ